MADTRQRQRNWPLWLGTLLIILTVLSSAPQAYSVLPQAILPWLALLLPAAAVLCFIVGLRRAFMQPQTYRGRILGSVLGVVALLVLAGSVLLLLQARKMPKSASAPRVGQKAPDFILKDTSGQTVTLAQMLATPIDSSTGQTPKAVLLVFYRGYW
jgi:hypothetical protein